MTVKIVFIDTAKGNYTPETPRYQPLGGSQSALCYLGEALAAAGHSVTVINGTRADVTVRGVRCLPIGSVTLEDLAGFHVVVVLNGCDWDLLRRLRATLGDERTLILWTQHAADQPAVANLAEAEVQRCLDGIAFVSRWQMDGYLETFGLDPARCRVMRNGIAPAFAGLFGPGEDILAAKPWPPVLAYTSVPFRGLDVLLDSFPLIRAAIPGTRLRVCSSLEAYQVSSERDPYTALYQRCRETDGVEYLGGLGQVALAGVLREATCLAYLNRFAETSCIAVLEALAAGCLVVSSQLGGLPESAAGFARLMPVPENPREHALRYAGAAVAALTELREDPGAGRRLRAQVNHANAETIWAVRAQGWIGWLEDLRAPVPVSAATAITAKIVSAQHQLMEALGTHLNSGDDRRLADPAWRAEARGMIELVERSLHLDHNDEEARTGVWAALRGYDAWLSYHTALPELPPPSPLPPDGRRIFDCFPFYNELDLLEVRLAELYPVVDRFVLVEATYTHAGAAKPLHYADNRARFAAYADKIVHIVVAEDPGGFAWNREAYQRDAILRGLGECRPDDMILISDADEILRAPIVERLRREPDEDAGTGATLFAPHLDIFLYFLDLKAPDPWVSVAAAPWELIRRIGANRARYLAKQGIGRVVPDAGWHFTWMGGADRFRAKLEAFAHREMIAGFDRDPQTNQARLDRFYATGRFDDGALPGMWTDLRRVPIDGRYPARIREALAHFRHLGWITPQADPTPETLLDEGRARERGGDGAVAEAIWRRAAALDPTDIEAFHALAERLLARNAMAEALRPLRCCTRLDPEGSFHLFKLAHSLLRLRRYEEGAEALRELIRREPEEHRAYGNLAVALKNLGLHERAVTVGRRALALMPADAGLLSNLGLALSMRIGGDEAAAGALSHALVLEPNHTETRMNRALVLRSLHRLDEAEAACRRLVAERPDDAGAHTLLATCLLMRGDLAPGFRAYEWRTQLTDGLADGQVETRGLPTPPWDGGDLDARRILLHDEQGLGDAIQFARYAPLLARRGARVIVECNDALARLFATLPGVATVVGRSAPTPAHDVHVALMSLPHLLGTTLATVPSEVPYLAAEPSLVERWRERLGPVRAGLRVGLVWAGNADLPDDPKRSPGLEPLLPLLDLPGVAFVSLQKGGGRADLERLGGRLPMGFRDVGDALDDLADTAAVVTHLDLVISVDSAVAHLAGALGRPVWTMLRAESEWRWMLERADSPWYPTMRLFRQTRAGDWSDVVAALRTALQRAVTEASR